MNLKQWKNLLADVGCLVCQQPAQLHHAGGGSMKERGVNKGKGTKNSDWLIIPLCMNHHTGNQGLHSLGVKTWEQKYGEQADFIDKLCEASGLDLWSLAENEGRVRK